MTLPRPLRSTIFAAGVVASLGIGLAGCATTADESPSLFVLDSGPTPAANTPNRRLPTVMIAPVETATYLNQGGIVFQTAPYRVVVANNNRWASSLSGQLTDTLYNVVSRRLRTANVRRATGNQQGLYVLQTRVDKFYGSHDGKAHISGAWQLNDPQGHPVRTSNFEQTVDLSRDGYPALVSSLSTGWQDVAANMTPALADALSGVTPGATARAPAPTTSTP